MTTTTRLAPAVLLAALLPLTACGGDDDPSGDAAAATDSLGPGIERVADATLVPGDDVPAPDGKTVLTLTGVRQMIVAAIPMHLFAAVAGGIGLFIGFIGLKNAGIIVANPATFVALGDLKAPGAALALFGLLLGLGLGNHLTLLAVAVPLMFGGPGVPAVLARGDRGDTPLPVRTPSSIHCRTCRAMRWTAIRINSRAGSASGSPSPALSQ